MLQTLLGCPEVTQVFIDTDSPTVADQSAEKFPSVLVLPRPKHLLGGEMPMMEILRYDATQVEADWYLQVHSTSPLLLVKQFLRV